MTKYPDHLHQRVQKQHRWSGWPGAFCLDCGIPDFAEECMADCDQTDIDGMPVVCDYHHRLQAQNPCQPK